MNTATNPHPVYLKAKAGEYLDVADLAALVRSALKREFPAVKFSVRSSRGSSVNVSWVDGPIPRDVDHIAHQFETKGFDGMIDLAHYRSLWLAPDGSAVCAHDDGTAGSMGTVPEYIGIAHHPDAILLDRDSGTYILCQRSVSNDLWVETAAKVLVYYGWSRTRWGQDKISIQADEVPALIAPCLAGRQLDPCRLPSLFYGDHDAWMMINLALSDPSTLKA